MIKCESLEIAVVDLYSRGVIKEILHSVVNGICCYNIVKTISIFFFLANLLTSALNFFKISLFINCSWWQELLPTVWLPDVQLVGTKNMGKMWFWFSVQPKKPQPLCRQWRGWWPRGRVPEPRGSVSWLFCCSALPPYGPRCGWLHGPEGEEENIVRNEWS